jgi:hypothetical protein
VFCAPGLIFGGTEVVGSRFHDLHARTRFRRYRGGRVPFSCFACLDSIWAVSSVSGPVFMFCMPGLIFGGTEGVGSRFHVLRALTQFGRYRGRPVPFSCFAPGLIFSGAECVESRFHVLRARTRLRRHLGGRVPFSCFALPDSISAVPRASGPVFTFCGPGLIFRGNKGVWSCFHVLRSQTHIRRYRGRRVPFSCFVCPDSFSAELRRRLPFSCFARSDLFSAVLRVSSPVFMFCPPGLIFSVTEASGPVFLLRAKNLFWRYRGRRLPY